jgi:hypothetical protein
MLGSILLIDFDVLLLSFCGIMSDLSARTIYSAVWPLSLVLNLSLIKLTDDSFFFYGEIMNDSLFVSDVTVPLLINDSIFSGGRDPLLFTMFKSGDLLL